MNLQSGLMRYKSAPSSLLSSFLEFQDWNDIPRDSLSSIIESEDLGSVFDDPFDSSHSKDVERLPGIVQAMGSTKDVFMFECPSTEASLDMFNLPELTDLWHPAQESRHQNEKRTAKVAFVESKEKVGSMPTFATSGAKRQSSSPPTKIGQFHSGMAGVLQNAQHKQNIFVKEPFCHTSVNEETNSHSIDLKRSTSILEGSSSDIQMMTLCDKDGNSMLSFPSSWGLTMQPSTGFSKPEQFSSGVKNENLAPLARSSSLPVSTTLKNHTLDDASHCFIPCQARAKRGCATHPRSVAERLRRTRISEKMKKLQELVPTSDKQLNTAEMLDEAVEYVKFLQQQVKELSENRQMAAVKTVELCK